MGSQKDQKVKKNKIDQNIQQIIIYYPIDYYFYHKPESQYWKNI